MTLIGSSIVSAQVTHVTLFLASAVLEPMLMMMTT